MGQERETWERARAERGFDPAETERFAVPSRSAFGSVFGRVADLATDPQTGPMVRQVTRTLDGAAEGPPMSTEKRIAHGLLWGLGFGVLALVGLHRGGMLPKRPPPKLSLLDRLAEERERMAAAPVERRKALPVTVRHE